MPNATARAPKTKATPKAERTSNSGAKPKAGRSASKSPAVAASAPSRQERERLIALAAYFRAEKRGFAPGYELQDWVEAEVEVKRLIGDR